MEVDVVLGIVLHELLDTVVENVYILAGTLELLLQSVYPVLGWGSLITEIFSSICSLVDIICLLGMQLLCSSKFIEIAYQSLPGIACLVSCKPKSISKIFWFWNQRSFQLIVLFQICLILLGVLIQARHLLCQLIKLLDNRIRYDVLYTYRNTTTGGSIILQLIQKGLLSTINTVVVVFVGLRDCIGSVALCSLQLDLLDKLVRLINLLLLNTNEITLIFFDPVNGNTIVAIYAWQLLDGVLVNLGAFLCSLQNGD